MGFAFVEVGTVTAQPQPGNPKPRLFRLTEDRALVNRMGFNNEGANAAATRLRARGRGVVVGVNIGKTKAVPDDEAIADYVASATVLADVAEYLVVNVSSPNTPGLRDLQAVERLRPLLVGVRAALDEAGARGVPLLVKIAPDLADEDIDAVADLTLELGLGGIIATNTTISRDGLVTDPAQVQAIGPGGVSGTPLKDRSLAVLRRLHGRVGDRLVLVAVGGIEPPMTPGLASRRGRRSYRPTPGSSTAERCSRAASTEVWPAAPARRATPRSARPSARRSRTVRVSHEDPGLGPTRQTG